MWSVRQQRFSIGMTLTVATLLAMPFRLQKPSNATVMTLIVEEQFIDGELRYLSLSETSAGRRLAFLFTIRGARVRFVTAYAMTPQQQEIYEEG